MKVTATKGSLGVFLKKHRDFIPLIDRVKEQGSTFIIKDTNESINNLKVLIPMFCANGTTNFSELTYENKPELSFLGTGGNPDIKNDSDLLSPYISMYMQGTRCNISANGPAYLIIHSISDYENTLVFEDDKFDFDFTFDSPDNPSNVIYPLSPQNYKFDPSPQFMLAV